jgi:pentatricopeptide repeat protein
MTTMTTTTTAGDNNKVTTDSRIYPGEMPEVENNAGDSRSQIIKSLVEQERKLENALKEEANNIQEYNTLLAECAKQGRAAEAEALMKRMVDRCKRSDDGKTAGAGGPLCEPNLDSYHLLLDAHANSGLAGAGERAEAILGQLVKDDSASRIAYNMVLKVWKNSDTPDATAKAEALLKRMADAGLADRISYTSYIGILAKQGDAASAERAQDIVEYMLQSDDVKVQPNSQTWNSVINAWVRCGKMKQAEKVLTRMEQYHAEGKTQMAPNVVSYTTVMDGWSKSRDKCRAVEKAEELFDRMLATQQAGNEDSRPNFWTYVTLINCYAKRKDVTATQKAEDLLFSMYDEYLAGNQEMRPNTQIVTVIMDAWQKSGLSNAGEKAEALLEWLIARYEQDRDEDLQPNEYSFSSAIAAWGKSRKIGKCIRAKRILDKMIDLHESGLLTASPNTVCYTAVINACAYCIEDDMDKREALRVAIETYKNLEMSEYGNPNHVTYSNLITALRNLLPRGESRDSAVRTVFESAAKGGYVDGTVVQRVQCKFLLYASPVVWIVNLCRLTPHAFPSLQPCWRRSRSVISFRRP